MRRVFCEVNCMKGSFKTIPHNKQRYDTAGDYFLKKNGSRKFFISELGNEDYNFLILIHEMIEFHLTEKRGIEEPYIAKFDMEYKGGFPDNPGDDPNAPYHREHIFAEYIESLVAKELGVDMDDYNKSFEKLQWE